MKGRILRLFGLVLVIALAWTGTTLGATAALPAISIQLGDAGGAGP
jgi:hypothetical protein